MIRSSIVASAVVFLVLAAASAGANSLPYEQHEDVVFADTGGIALVMDVFVPTGKKNGLAIIDIASGSWHSDRGKINDHKMARMYDIFCGKGYTVFAVRPGSRSLFTVKQMAAHIKTSIRWVKAHADEYGIDPERLGLAGASAGGHLASLVAVTPDAGNPKARDPLARLSTDVAAVGVFFPPTNFLVWGEGKPDFRLIGDVLFRGGIDGHSQEDIEREARAISPGLLIKGKTPPFLIWHGDADPLVPLQQSEFMVKQLKSVGTDVEFYVKPGGGHPWMTINEEVQFMGDWFDKQLVGQ